jgi:hypothetical protein
MRKYTRDQIIDALNCPINRHCTRVEHNCDDWALHEHPMWLIEHYIKCGGAKEFAKRRDQYWEEQDELEKKNGGGSKDGEKTSKPAP